MHSVAQQNDWMEKPQWNQFQKFLLPCSNSTNQRLPMGRVVLCHQALHVNVLGSLFLVQIRTNLQMENQKYVSVSRMLPLQFFVFVVNSKYFGYCKVVADVPLWYKFNWSFFLCFLGYFKGQQSRIIREERRAEVPGIHWEEVFTERLILIIFFV